MRKIFVAIIWSLAAVSSYAVADDSRLWKDSTGKFSVEAKLVSSEDGQVVLKTTAGKEIKI